MSEDNLDENMHILILFFPFLQESVICYQSNVFALIFFFKSTHKHVIYRETFHVPLPYSVSSVFSKIPGEINRKTSEKRLRA